VLSMRRSHVTTKCRTPFILREVQVSLELSGFRQSYQSILLRHVLEWILMPQGKTDRGLTEEGIRRAALFVAIGLLAAGAMLRAASSTEQELRARVEQLYGALQRSDWRQAEKYLTKESRPIFRNLPKRPVRGYEIESVKLQANGEGAEVVVGTPASFGMMPGRPLFIPQRTYWRQVKGRWYLELPEARAGGLPSNQLGQERASAPPLSLHPKDLKFQFTWQSVGSIHKGEVKVARFPFTNVSQRAVTLADVQTDCPCLRIKSLQREFKPGEAGALEFELDPSNLSFDTRTALTLTATLDTEPEHAQDQLTVRAVLMPGSDQSLVPKH